MNKIPIVISSDNNLFFTIGVVLTSLLENAKEDTFYEINVLYTSDVTRENLERLQKIKENYKNMSIAMFNMTDKFKDLPSTNGYHVNYVSAYKMLIPSMFTQYDKLIYLDTDIIVRDDLQEMYNFNIGDNYLAGAPVISNFIEHKDKITKMTGMPNLDYYINAGVIIMNLKKIREDKIDEEWIKLLGSYEGSVDQHILNKVCYGKTIYFPIKFNVCISEIQFFNNNHINIFYSKEEAEKALKNPIIFHWTGKIKPWIYDDTFLAQEWFKYYSKSPYGDIILYRNQSGFFQKIKPYKKTYHLLGIPILKCKINEHGYKTYYLFDLIKFLKIKNGR